MPLTKRISPVGNSAGLLFDKPILQQVGWEMGTEVDVTVKGETIVLSRHQFADTSKVKASAQLMAARHRKSLDKLGR